MATAFQKVNLPVCRSHIPVVQLHKILFVKKKNTAHAVQAKDFVGVKQRQNESGVLRGGKSFHGE